jgi:ABC-type transport system substrate-binding protein
MRIALVGLALAGAAALATGLPAQPRAAAPACRIALPAAADAESFTAADRGGGPASAQQTGTVFAAAAARLCATGAVRPADFARYRRLLVRNAEGAMEPNIYDDAEEQPGALIIEFAFVDGPPPAQAQVETAIRCWRAPDTAGCSEEDMGP